MQISTDYLEMLNSEKIVKVGGESLMVYYEYMKQSKKDLKSCDDFIDVVDKSVLARYVDNIENPELIRKIIKLTLNDFTITLFSNVDSFV